jgi:CO dehydrogenase maturation factor
MEHISRRTARNVDYLLVVADAAVRAVRTAGKINRLSEDLAPDIGEKYLIVNRLTGGLSGPVADAIKEEGLHHLASIPEDNRLLSLDRLGKPIWPALADTKAYRAVDAMMTRLLAG